MTSPTPRTMTAEEIEADLADREVEIADRLADLSADPEVAARMREPVAPLTAVREMIARHNRDPRADWSPDEAATLLQLHGDLAHDLDLVRELVALRGYVGLPRLLRDERLGGEGG